MEKVSFLTPVFKLRTLKNLGQQCNLKLKKASLFQKIFLINPGVLDKKLQSSLWRSLILHVWLFRTRLSSTVGETSSGSCERQVVNRIYLSPSKTKLLNFSQFHLEMTKIFRRLRGPFKGGRLQTPFDVPPTVL